MRLILALSVLVSLAQSYKSYDGHQVKQHSRERSEQTTEMIQVLRTTQLDITASDLLREVMLEADLDFWKEPAPGKSADMYVRMNSAHVGSCGGQFAARSHSSCSGPDHTLVPEIC